MRQMLLAGCGMALLSACSLIPDYQRPAAPVSQTWPAGPAYEADQPANGRTLWADLGWQQFFTDPGLRRVIQAALDNNRDLKVAALNIEVARASYRITEADLLPAVNGAAGMQQSRTPRLMSTTVPQRAVTAKTYQADVSASWEIDLFGRLRSLDEQALEQYLATEEARTSTQISLIAEVAQDYLTLLADQKLLAVTEDTLTSRQRSFDLTKASFERGASSQLDLSQARQSLETARANRALYIRQVEQDRNALVLLVGAPLDQGWLPAEGSLDAVHFVEDLPVGLPSDVLLRRPDVVQAEHSLKAANANIGAARAAFFPTISLTGQAGFESPALSKLFQGAAGAWSYAPQMSVPIFDGGINQANLDSAKASRDISVAQYEKAIQSAFADVANALAGKKTLVEQLDAQQGLVEASQTSLTLSRARYQRGVSSYLDVLDSERTLYAAQQTLISVQLSRLTNLISLYKAVGGGRA